MFNVSWKIRSVFSLLIAPSLTKLNPTMAPTLAESFWRAPSIAELIAVGVRILVKALMCVNSPTGFFTIMATLPNSLVDTENVEVSTDSFSPTASPSKATIFQHFSSKSVHSTNSLRHLVSWTKPKTRLISDWGHQLAPAAQKLLAH